MTGQKRQCSGQGVLATHDSAKGGHVIGQEEGMGVETTDPVMRDESQVIESLGGEGRGLETGFRGCGDMDTDLLAKVFSYVPQRELFEVMRVSRLWEKAVMESSGLWRKVDMSQIRDFRRGGEVGQGGEGGGRENEILRRVLGMAEMVQLSHAFMRNGEYRTPLKLALGSNLRTLVLPALSVTATFLRELLPNCPQLQKLVMEGWVEESILGTGPVHIRHSNLRSLDMQCHNSRALLVECPSLTFLSTFESTELKDYKPPRAPSLRCPKLTKLRLSPVHCAGGVLESMAALALDITALAAFCTVNSPFRAVFHIKSLRILKVDACTGIPPDAFVNGPFWRPCFSMATGSLQIWRCGIKGSSPSQLPTPKAFLL